MFSKLLGMTLFFGMLAFVAGAIHPIDVEPVMKKEHPDFEPPMKVYLKKDDSALPSLSRENVGEAKNTAEADDVVSMFSGGSEVGFTHAFVASLCVIIVSELGDKTFFIAAIMAMSHARLTVFSGAMLALAGMHIMSALFGYVITVIPRVFTFYASSALFALFGLKMLREGCKMSPDEGLEEFEEVQTDLRRREDDYQREPLEEAGGGMRKFGRNRILRIVSRIFIQAMVLTFLAEWGDRSQIATVILAAREDVTGVIIGGLLGHFLCTGLAVIGGRMIASKISIRTVTIIGGIVFLLFAFSAVIMGP